MVLNIKGIICMADKLDPKELVSFKELLMADFIQGELAGRPFVNQLAP